MPRGWIPRKKSAKKSSSLWKALNGLLLSEAAPPSCRHSPHAKSNLAHGKIGISISAIFHCVPTHYVALETEGQRTAVNEIVKESKSRGVTFLTAVAGTAVLGVQFAILTPFMTVAASLWVFAVLLWIHANLHVFCRCYRGRA